MGWGGLFDNVSKWFTPERRAKSKREKLRKLERQLRKLNNQKWNPKLSIQKEKVKNEIKKITDSLIA